MESWLDTERVERVQYSETLFPVFVLMSSLISVMQRKWTEETKESSDLKAICSEPKKKIKTYGFYTHIRMYSLQLVEVF